MKTLNHYDCRRDTVGIMAFLGIRSRATLIKKEKAGLIPKRKLFPDGKLGLMESELQDWASKAEEVA